jgi:hypothetical protein
LKLLGKLRLRAFLPGKKIMFLSVITIAKRIKMMYNYYGGIQSVVDQNKRKREINVKNKRRISPFIGA